MATSVNIKSHLEFRDFLFDIQKERQNNELDKRGHPVSFEKLTKAILNLFNANIKLKDMVIGVKIDEQI